MTYPIHLMSRSSQEGAKNQLDLQLRRKGFGYGLDDLSPYILGIGIGEGSVSAVGNFVR
jgi:hypothetical protein